VYARAEKNAAVIVQGNIWTADFVRTHLAQERARFALDYDSPKAQAALESRTWWIATLVFFREKALVGYPKTGIDVGHFDVRIDEAFAELAVWLGEAGR